MGQPNLSEMGIGVVSKFLAVPLNILVNDFAFFVGIKVEEETIQLCIVHVLMLENGIVTSDIFFHLSLSPQNFSVPPTTFWRVARFQVMRFNTPTLFKARRIVSSSTLVPTKNAKSERDRGRCSEQLSLGEIAKLWRDKDKCSKISDVTIPFSNNRTCTAHNWFDSSSTFVHTKNAKSLTPILRGIGKMFWGDRDRCREISCVAIPYSNTSQSATHSLFVPSCTLVPTKNAKSLTPIFRGTAKF